ncbi:hypothetical protein DFP72DRAFT_1052568 [Ephemerocybe angulata]|uniref:Uncharacterized protein n=1 Tax=Ephemerocybe angulata TaxID=980116 RepID=A0A8H6LV55_9AGAR|nr:hypothetical protein DFP72DRAFT_1052568 [Tulosesus angulatus]
MLSGWIGWPCCCGRCCWSLGDLRVCWAAPGCRPGVGGLSDRAEVGIAIGSATLHWVVWGFVLWDITGANNVAEEILIPSFSAAVKRSALVQIVGVPAIPPLTVAPSQDSYICTTSRLAQRPAPDDYWNEPPFTRLKTRDEPPPQARSTNRRRFSFDSPWPHLNAVRRTKATSVLRCTVQKWEVRSNSTSTSPCRLLVPRANLEHFTKPVTKSKEQKIGERVRRSRYWGGVRGRDGGRKKEWKRSMEGGGDSKGVGERRENSSSIWAKCASYLQEESGGDIEAKGGMLGSSEESRSGVCTALEFGAPWCGGIEVGRPRGTVRAREERVPESLRLRTVPWAVAAWIKGWSDCEGVREGAGGVRDAVWAVKWGWGWALHMQNSGAISLCYAVEPRMGVEFDDEAVARMSGWQLADGAFKYGPPMGPIKRLPWVHSVQALATAPYGPDSKVPEESGHKSPIISGKTFGSTPPVPTDGMAEQRVALVITGIWANDGRTGDAWGAIYWVWSGVSWRMDAAGGMTDAPGECLGAISSGLLGVSWMRMVWVAPGGGLVGKKGDWRVLLGL